VAGDLTPHVDFLSGVEDLCFALDLKLWHQFCSLVMKWRITLEHD
jgi:hypothetical protein